MNPLLLGDEIYTSENSLEKSKSSYKYDIITMFHVHYYWRTPEKRIAVMKKLLKHLNPKHGMLFILILDQGVDNQIQLRRETKSKLYMVETPKVIYNRLAIISCSLVNYSFQNLAKAYTLVTEVAVTPLRIALK